jgi:hypothetical protein
MAHGQRSENTGRPFAFYVDPSAEVHLAVFYLSFATRTEYSGVDSFYLTIGTPELLLVDDDDGDEYERQYQRYLAANGIPFQPWSMAKHVPGDTLRDFDVVIWFTGRAREQTLTADDQDFLSAYLDGGGKLFLSGQDIGHDLVEMGNGAEFYSQYLHAGFVADVSADRFLQKVPGDPITGSMPLAQIDPVAESPDVIVPLAGAYTALEYGPGMDAAIRYGDGYRLAYFVTGLEYIEPLSGSSETLRAGLMDNIVNWLQFVPSRGDVNEDGKINILDVVWTVNIILGLATPTPSQSWAADFTHDSTVNILDAIAIVNDILGPVGKTAVDDGEMGR